MKSVFVLLLFLPLCIGWWPFDEEETETNENIKPENTLVPFEITTVEQKFLQEANELLQLSPLDYCQHKVVDSLKQSCGKLSEEDIAKLSVQLLNCQSQAEGRDIYPCNDEMSIADCTRSMDAHIWNTYHIISNRARSVCYTIRQSQFKIQTELAVNKLSQSTIYQLKTMEELSMNQDEIRQTTIDSLNVLKEEKVQLLDRQEELANYHNKLKESWEDNLDQLIEERNLINNGQTMIHNMTEKIKDQLGFAQAVLIDHENNQKQYQQNMSNELNKMRDNIKEVWSTIDNSTDRLLQVVNQLNSQYNDMQGRLITINNTISHVLLLMDGMNESVDIQLGWILNIVGGAQDGMYVLTTMATHGIFLLITCLVLLFLKAPWLSRLLLLLIVVINLLVDINTTTGGLSVIQLVVLVGIVLIGDFMFVSYKHNLHYKRLSSITTPISPPPSTSTNSSIHTIDISDNEIDDILNDRVTPISTMVPTTMPGIIEEYSNCLGHTRSGLPCRLTTTPGSKYCYRHNH